jgi:uncharacterized protein involved in exopolysaccharide biosynthesis
VTVWHSQVVLPERLAGVVELFRQPRVRRIAYAVAALLFAVLAIVPRHYLARAKFLNQDEDGGLTAVLGTLGAGGLQQFANTIGNHQSSQVALLIGQSNNIAMNVVNRLHLVGPHRYSNANQAMVALARKVDVHMLNGGVLEIEAKDRDPTFSLTLVNAYMSAIEDRNAELTREQTAEKKAVVTARFADASDRLSKTQAELDEFRRANNMADPEAQFGAALSLKTGLEGELQAKQLALQTTEQFATPDSLEVKALRADIAGLQGQIARDDTNSPAGNSSSLNSKAEKTVEYLNIYRQERFAEALYNVYVHALEQISVQEMVTETRHTVQVIEDPYVDPSRQFNVRYIGMLIVVMLLAFYTEYYAPATRLSLRRGSSN